MIQGARLAWLDHPGGHRLLAVVTPSTALGGWHCSVLTLHPRRPRIDTGGSCASTRWPVGEHQVEDQLRALGWPGLPADWQAIAVEPSDHPWPEALFVGRDAKPVDPLRPARAQKRASLPVGPKEPHRNGATDPGPLFRTLAGAS